MPVRSLWPTFSSTRVPRKALRVSITSCVRSRRTLAQTPVAPPEAAIPGEASPPPAGAGAEAGALHGPGTVAATKERLGGEGMVVPGKPSAFRNAFAAARIWGILAGVTR